MIYIFGKNHFRSSCSQSASVSRQPLPHPTNGKQPQNCIQLVLILFFSSMFQLIRSQVACFMVTEPSIDEELVPKSEDVNGNQEILMDQVLSKSSFLLPSL